MVHRVLGHVFNNTACVLTVQIAEICRVKNHFVSNPINSKLIRLKKNFKKLKSKNQNTENARKNEKFAWCSTENFQLTEASQLVSAN